MTHKLIIQPLTNELRQIDPCITVRFVRGNDMVDHEFRIRRRGKDTGWAIQCGLAYGCVTRWIEEEQAEQSWCFPLLSQAVSRLPDLIRRHGL